RWRRRGGRCGRRRGLRRRLRFATAARRKDQTQDRALDRHETRQLLHETLKGLLGMPLACAFKIIDNLPRRESLPEEAAGPVPPAPAQLEAAPKPDPSLLNSVIQLFEGRVLPGEG
ncbi:MAG: hypothetical protein HYZ93_02375, partial [Candidatus Omnitrophica bacterium]|nr:hypothetical protein [Candidatus Omnitrophota bacterium]